MVFFDWYLMLCSTLTDIVLASAIPGVHLSSTIYENQERKTRSEQSVLMQDMLQENERISPVSGRVYPVGATSRLDLPSHFDSETSPACDSSSIIWHPPIDDKDFSFYPSLDTPGWPLVPDRRKLTYLTLVNGSPYSFNVTSKDSRQMNRFDPQDVESGVSRQFAQQYQFPSLFGRWANCKGTASYEIEVKDSKAKNFQFDATTNGRMMAEKYSLEELSTSGRDTRTVSESFELNQRGGSRAFNLVVTGSEKFGRYYTSADTPVAWMHELLEIIGDRKLKHVCMLGSHDAGMSKINGSTAFVDWRNVQTQGFDVYGQLIAGSRYLDIRPVIANGGNHMTGHYNLPSDVPFGANGQTLEEIVSNINKFTRNNPELVILRLTHAYNTDEGYRPFNESEYDGAFDILEGLENRCENLKGDITELKMNDLIGDDKACVIVITTGGKERPGKGIYAGSQSFPVVDHWSNTDSVTKMADDQLSHLSGNRQLSSKSTKDKFLIFQWLLTLEALENVSVSDWISIESLAVRLAYDPLFWKAWNGFTPEKYPSVILMDYIGVLQQGERRKTDDVARASREGGSELRNAPLAGKFIMQ
ncbi:hypothetical protein KEM54_002872 [Ascosphaera aggregata]|nr:hypothetical protein KEM54_002872 [Ascosphaera aggregata]